MEDGGQKAWERQAHGALIEGDFRRACSLLCRAYQHLIVRYCARILRDDTAALDIAQDVFVIAWNGLGEYRGDGQFAAWLCGIARRRCLQKLRDEGRRRALSRLHEPLIREETAATVGSTTDGRLESENLVDWAMATLDDVDRSILFLHAEGLSSAEIAQAHAELGIVEESVRGRIFRARKVMRERLALADARPDESASTSTSTTPGPLRTPRSG